MIANIEGEKVRIFDDGLKNGLWKIKGAISFPRENELKVEGCVMLGMWNGVDLLVPECRMFSSIEHVINDNLLVREGISSFFNNMWLNYKSRSLYYSDDRDFCRKYRRDISRSNMIEPKPGFVRLKTYDLSEVFVLLDGGHLKYKKNGMVQKALYDYESSHERDLVIDTLGILAHGFKRR